MQIEVLLQWANVHQACDCHAPQQLTMQLSNENLVLRTLLFDKGRQGILCLSIVATWNLSQSRAPATFHYKSTWYSRLQNLRFLLAPQRVELNVTDNLWYCDLQFEQVERKVSNNDGGSLSGTPELRSSNDLQQLVMVPNPCPANLHSAGTCTLALSLQVA